MVTRRGIPLQRPNHARVFPEEASMVLRVALNNVLSLSLSLHNSSSLAFGAFALFVLFPRMLLHALPDGCQGRFVASTITRRCKLLRKGKVAILLREAHEAQAGRVSRQVKASSIPSSATTFSKTARAAILAGARAGARAFTSSPSPSVLIPTSR